MTIQQKARTALAARDAGDSRWFFLVVSLCIKTGLDPAQTESEIERLAAGGAPR